MKKFRCVHCKEEHDGIPAFHADRPAPYWDVPVDKRDSEVFLTSDSCVIAERFFYVHGCLEIPVHEIDQPFIWGVWVSLKEENFFLWQDHYETAKRSHIGPFFGWLCTRLPVYPNTLHLKTTVHIRDNGIRPFIELDQTDHLLSMEQSKGIGINRVHELMHLAQST